MCQRSVPHTGDVAMPPMIQPESSTVAPHNHSLSEFKISRNQIKLKPHFRSGGRFVVKTLGTERHNTLIALLVEKREAAGLTQTELAAKLGEYQSFVARLESGQRRVDVVEFLELAELLNFDPAKAIQHIVGS